MTHDVMAQPDSNLDLDAQVDEAWVNRFLSRQHLVVPVTSKYNLENITIDLQENKILVRSDIVEKAGSQVIVTCLPDWDAASQRIKLNELNVELFSKNLLLKGAGWFARTFMSARLGSKVESAVNQLWSDQVKTWIRDDLHIPLPDGGQARVDVRSITIHQLQFESRTIKVKVSIGGHWHLRLP